VKRRKQGKAKDQVVDVIKNILTADIGQLRQQMAKAGDAIEAMAKRSLEGFVTAGAPEAERRPWLTGSTGAERRAELAADKARALAELKRQKTRMGEWWKLPKIKLAPAVSTSEQLEKLDEKISRAIAEKTGKPPKPPKWKTDPAYRKQVIKIRRFIEGLTAEERKNKLARVGAHFGMAQTTAYNYMKAAMSLPVRLIR
jgi:hypothetical protein